LVTYSHGVDPVFKALADPTRRAVLDALFVEDGRSLSQLCELFPDLTRFGVMKHLRVLEDANLLTTVKVGRTKLHHLNPIPIHQIAERWLDKYAVPMTGAMLGLKRRLEA
jgi:DNA-binding transcriptional ArsR family regulator